MKAAKDAKEEGRRRIKAEKKKRTAVEEEAEKRNKKKRKKKEEEEEEKQYSGRRRWAPGKGDRVTKCKLKLLSSDSTSSTPEDSQAVQRVFYTSKLGKSISKHKSDNYRLLEAELREVRLQYRQACIDAGLPVLKPENSISGEVLGEITPGVTMEELRQMIPDGMFPRKLLFLLPMDIEEGLRNRRSRVQPQAAQGSRPSVPGAQPPQFQQSSQQQPQQSAQQSGRHRFRPRGHQFKKKQGSSSFGSGSSSSSSSPRATFCGQCGGRHPSTLCTRVQGSCNICGQYGHFARVCPLAGSQHTAAPPQGRAGGSSRGRPFLVPQSRMGETQHRPFQQPGPSRFDCLSSLSSQDLSMPK
ncbi:hypothetical protein F511_21299 [Dorcoceras hygrometricum]|uniref:CCHC-type domain-containing protein n=1 Tax=Dorcoceras hygrometricum TaxID=472368 RepID=A0A2Z7BKY2_9LAMI|nr:hypothetical protein F511_21299 [Dorcoceras hygrometricum]